MERDRSLSARFLIIWAGQLLSRIGSGVSAFALGVHLYQTTGSTAAYSLLLLAAFLPSVLLAPVGGVIADRRNRKLMMAVGDLGSGLGILVVIAMVLMHPERHWPIYLGVAVSSVFAALHSPAFKAAVTDLLDEAAYARAGGLIQLAEASRYLLAPVLAAVLLARFSLTLVLAVDVATFLVAALTAILVENRSGSRITAVESGAGFRNDLAEGFRALLGNRVVANLLVVTSVVTFFTGMLQALFAPLILSFADAGTLGTVQSLAASGMLLSSLLIGVASKTGAQERVLSRSLFAAGLFYLLIGTSTSPALITVTAFCFFATLPFVNTSLEVLFRQSIDNRLQGRVWSLVSLISQSGMLVAFGVAGVLADHLFNPLLIEGGVLAGNVGSVIGIGAARGSGLMVVVAGGLLAVFSLLGVKRRGYFETHLQIGGRLG